MNSLGHGFPKPLRLSRTAAVTVHRGGGKSPTQVFLTVPISSVPNTNSRL
jgi:hypothetical protein